MKILQQKDIRFKNLIGSAQNLISNITQMTRIDDAVIGWSTINGHSRLIYILRQCLGSTGQTLVLWT